MSLFLIFNCLRWILHVFCQPLVKISIESRHFFNNGIYFLRSFLWLLFCWLSVCNFSRISYFLSRHFSIFTVRQCFRLIVCTFNCFGRLHVLRAFLHCRCFVARREIHHLFLFNTCLYRWYSLCYVCYVACNSFDVAHNKQHCCQRNVKCILCFRYFLCSFFVHHFNTLFKR